MSGMVLADSEFFRSPGGPFPRGALAVLLGFILAGLLASCGNRSLNALSGDGTVHLLEEARSLAEGGDPAGARELLVTHVGEQSQDLRILRALARLAREAGDSHEALVWLDMGDTAMLELALLCLDRSRLLWQLRGDRFALENAELCLRLMDMLEASHGEGGSELSVLRSVAASLRDGMAEALHDKD